MNSYNPMRAMISSIVRGVKPAAAVVKAPAATPVLDAVQPTEAEKAKAILDAAAIESQRLLDEQAVLDSAAAAAAAADPEAAAAAAAAAAALAAPVFDSANDPGSNYSDTDVALKAVAAIQEWAETDDLDEGEGYADRLMALMVGIADVDVDGELSDDEGDLVDIALNTAWDYLSDKGVSDEDLDLLLNDWNNEAGARVQELIVSKLPDGDEASADEMDSFVFGDGSDEAALDSAVLDATYRKKIVVRKGKKKRINKRVAGHVRLSPKQKLAVRKMLRKSHSAKATMRRAKSVRVRKQLGL